MSASGLPLRKSARHPAHRQETRRQETRREAIARHRRLFLEPLEQRQLLTVVDPYPPSGENDTYSVTENVALSTSAPGVLGNDTDPNGDALTAIHYSGPGSGTLLFNADGSFTYTPAADFVGSDSFTYQAFDGALSSGLVTVTLNVEADNQAPSTNPDSYSVDQGTALTVSAPGLLANDSDSNGDPITAALASGPANGTVSINPDGSFTYEPNSGFYGTDSFSYVANDGEDDSVATPVQITVNYVPPPPPPVANPDYYPLDEDTSLWVPAAQGVLENDQRDSQESTLVFGVTNGTLTLNPDGSFWYTPNANFHGEDSFTYQLAENVQATVYLTVNAVNDPPQVGDTSYWGYEDQQIIESSGALRNNASDADGLDGLEVELVGQAGNGHVEISTYGSFVYTPNANYWGLDSFTYRVFDGFEYSNPATVSLTIYSTNDPPVALDDTFSLVEDEQCFTADLLANDFDIDGDTMNVTLPYMPGLTQLSGGFIQYIPPANYSGTVTFTYQVNDWQWGMSTATVTFNILEVNDAPVASDDAFSIDEDGSLQVGSWYGPYGILGNDTDPDTGTAPTNAQIVSGPAHGALVMDIGGSFTYTPNANFHGTDQFTYQAVDGNGGTSNTATVSITVNSVNDLPIVVSESLKVAEDTSLAIDGGTLLPVSNVLANDSDLADGDTLWVSQFDFPAHGTLTLQNNGDFLYTPWANYHGPDSFTYLVSDGWSQVMGSVMIEVTPVNDAPEVVGESYTLDEDSFVNTGNVLSNDSDVDNDNLTVSLNTPPAYGTVTSDGNGGFIYTPAPNYNVTLSNNMPDSFTYTVSDGHLQVIGTVVLTVASVNDAPQVTGEFYTLDEDTFVNMGNLLSNDSDVENDTLSVSLNTQPAYGTVTSDGSGGFIYTPVANYNYNINNAPDIFTYLVSDGLSQVIGTVALTVNAVAPKLSINDVTATEAVDGELVFEVTLDEDANGAFSVDFTTFKLSAEDAPTLHAAPGGIHVETQDYVATNGTLTSTGAKGVVGLITISLKNDNMAELTETLQVKLSNIQSTDPAIASNVTFADDVGDGTINDDDAIRVEFLGTPISPTNEGTDSNTPLPFYIALFRPDPIIDRPAMADGPITITYVIENKTTGPSSIPGITPNASTSDYVDVTGGTLTLPAYSSRGIIQLEIVGDRTVEEALKSFNVVIKTITAGGRPATVAPPNTFGAVNMAIVDDDKAKVQFSQTPPFSVTEGAHDSGLLRLVRVTVKLTAPVDVPFTADVFTQTPFAPPPAFNPATSSATINVPESQVDYVYKLETFEFSGAAFQQFDFDIRVKDDFTAESDEMFEVAISIGGFTSPRDVTAGPDLPVQIRDNDIAVVSIADKRIYETDAFADTVGTVNYTLSIPSDSVTTFTITDTPGTALAGIDYRSTIYPLTVTVPPNTTSGTFNVPIFNDTMYTGDRAFTLKITSVTSASFSVQTGISPTSDTATITIDEDEWW